MTKRYVLLNWDSYLSLWRNSYTVFDKIEVCNLDFTTNETTFNYI